MERLAIFKKHPAIKQSSVIKKIRSVEVLSTYAVLFTDASSVFQVASPRKTQSAHFKVTICEHICEAKSVVVFLWKENKQKLKK